MSDAQAAVQALLDDLITSDVERGLQVAVHRDSHRIVDAWAGLADPLDWTGR